MESRVALVGIIIEDLKASTHVNALLHEVADKVLCRTGYPYRSRGLHIISVLLDASANEINALAGKLGRLSGVSVKTIMTNAGD